jgi:hypothetical protein
VVVVEEGKEVVVEGKGGRPPTRLYEDCVQVQQEKETCEAQESRTGA